MNLKPNVVRLCVLLFVAWTLAGCVAQTAFRQAQTSAKREDWDGAVLGYSKALGLDPGNDRYKAALMRAKLKASALHFERGKRYLESGLLELAITELEQTLFLDSDNQYASVELEKAKGKLERLRATPSEIEMAKAAARKASLAPPKLSPASSQPIVLKFKEQPVQKIYDAISKISGINFLYDDKMDTDLKQNKSVDLAGVTFERAMDILMLQFKHFYKVIDENTLYIAQDNRAKRTELEDKVIRTFFLSNGDTKQVNTLLRSLLEIRRIAENPQLNSITIKESPDVVEVAEKIIDSNDKAKAELIIDVELLEINRTTLQNLGIDLSTKSLALTFLGGTSLPLNNLRPLRSEGNWSIGPIPGAIINFLKSDSDTKTLSKPQLRVTEGEKAELHIGDRVPIPTTTFNTSNTVGGNIIPVTSFTYQNTGIQLTIEPRVHHNKEVTLKLNVEVSSVSGEVQGTGGISQPVIGTRQIQTVVRLRDGETNMLSGLIREEDKTSTGGVPGLSSIPGLKRLFGNQNDSKTVLDIILTLTPHIIRIPDISETDLEPIWVGTEDNTKLRGKTRATNAFGETPFSGIEDAAPGAAAAPAPAAPPTPQPPPPPPPAPAVQAPPKVEQPPPEEFEEEEEEFDDEELDTEDPAPADQNPGGPPKPSTPSSLSQVILVAPRSTYTVGEVVTLQVQLVGGQNVGSVPYHLRFNPGVLEFVQANEGDFLLSGGAQTVFVAQEIQGGGEVVVGHSRVGFATGAAGSGLLATFQFRAKGAGNCTLSFTGAAVRDPNANNLPASFTTAVINVAPAH